jgi:3-hydroxyisobutyrate dehydrogenase-like beta-hydroxyacid dehydrogenase
MAAVTSEPGTVGTVGIIGLGTMGSAIAEALRPHHHLIGWDVDEAAVDRQRMAGTAAATNLTQVADEAEVVLLSLPGPDEVRRVVSEPGGLLTAAHPPLVIVDLSTVDPQTTRDQAAAAAGAGVGYLDAPALGRPHRCGDWTLPVGGTEEDLAHARPILERLATRIVRVGGHGRGNIVKLLNNLMFGAINAITAETMGTAARLGLDPLTYATTVASSGAASVSGLFTEIAPKIASRDWTPVFTVDLLAKDNQLALTMLEQAGVQPPVARAIVELNRAGQAAGLGPLDTSAIVQLFAGPE